MKKTLNSKNQQSDLLIAELTGKPREYILAHPEIKLSTSQQKRLRNMQEQLIRGVPLAYILEHKWFYGRKFAVNKNVLIPRPETELLVELAWAWAKKHEPQLVADIGTGSGAIIISLADLLSDNATGKPGRKPKTEIKYLATDISATALKTAKKNASLQASGRAKKSAGIIFLRDDLAKPLEKYIAAQDFCNILITANLPYLSKKEMAEPTIKYEPKLALWGGKKSFNLIAKLIKQLAQLQRKHGLKLKNSAIFLEINYNQSAQALQAIKKHLPGARAKVHKDLRGFPRVAEIIFE